MEAVATRRERHDAAIQRFEADRALLHACAASEDRRALDLATVKLSGESPVERVIPEVGRGSNYDHQMNPAEAPARAKKIALENPFYYAPHSLRATSPRSRNRPSSHEKKQVAKTRITLPAARRPPPRGAVVEVVVRVRVRVPRAQFRDQRPRAAPGAVD